MRFYQLLTILVCGTLTNVVHGNTCTFSLLPGTTANAGSGTTELAVGDFNGDGRDDLVVVNSGSMNATLTSGTSVVRAVHFMEMRSAMQ